MLPGPFRRAVCLYRKCQKNSMFAKSFEENLYTNHTAGLHGKLSMHSRAMPRSPLLMVTKPITFYDNNSMPLSITRNQTASAADATKKQDPKTKPATSAEEVTIYFIKNGNRTPVKTKIGATILDIVVDNMDLLDMDGFGACEGTLACSTCHVILKKQDFQRVPNKPSEEELDMLDLAYDLTDTSRLGCQITITKEFDGLEVSVPKSVQDARLT